MITQVLSKRAELLSPERIPYLSDEERAQVGELLARLEQECEQDVRRVILYGSKARGDAVPWSDVDLLVVTTNGTELVEKICNEYHYENLFIVAVVFSFDNWKYYQ